jgi:hypothetical protein
MGFASSETKILTSYLKVTASTVKTLVCDKKIGDFSLVDGGFTGGSQNTGDTD